MTIETIHEIIRELNAVRETTGTRVMEGSATPQQMLYFADLVQTRNIKLVGEIGFNAGFSSYIFLHAAPNVRVISFDLARHAYVSAAKLFIDNKFPGRHTLICGDSKKTLPLFKKEHPNTIFDLFFIDGGHDYETAKADVCNVRDLCNENSLVVMDDLTPWVGYGVGPTKVWHEALTAAMVVQEELVKDGQRVEVIGPPAERAWALGRYVYNSSQAS